MSIQKKLKNKTRQFIGSKHMLSSVTTASFLESTIVPIPLEAVLVPLMQARRDKLWLIALMATLGCMMGALFGYTLGYYLFDALGDWIIKSFSTPEQFENIQQKMQDQGFWFVLTLGVLPIPFQIAMLAAGATKYSLTLFLLAAALARSIRYFGLAMIVYYTGDQAEKMVREHTTKTTITLTIIVMGSWGISNLM